MTGVLYISYTGVMSPLGRSQVLNYVRALARQRPIHLLSFERPEALRDTQTLREIEALCRDSGVTWHRRVYHHRPGLPATVWDIAAGTVTGAILAQRHSLRILHCRSYVAGLMGLGIKAVTGARFLFDMRGFWPDERIDGGIWRRDSALVRAVRRVERRLLARADHIVCLTRSGAKVLPVLAPRSVQLAPVSVIPTCTDLGHFRLRPMPQGAFTLGYVGSTGSWYLFDAVAQAVAVLFANDPAARFRIVTQSDHDEVRKRLAAQGVALDRVDLVSVGFDAVPAEIARMSAGIFFITPKWSKRASCPTRMGEFLASGRPILANKNVGDVADDLSETGTGLAIACGGGHSPTPVELADALAQLRACAADPATPARCRAAAEARFSLKIGVERYEAIYRRLSDATQPAQAASQAWGTQ